MTHIHVMSKLHHILEFLSAIDVLPECGEVGDFVDKRHQYFVRIHAMSQTMRCRPTHARFCGFKRAFIDALSGTLYFGY